MQSALHCIKIRLETLLLLGLLTAALLLGQAGMAFLHPQNAHATSTQAQDLLLIHGIGDTCSTAFNSTDNSSPGVNATTTTTYFENNGWGSTTIWEVGYYNKESGCNVNLQVYDTHCTSYSNGQDGTTNDPLRHLGCLFAWFIYSQFGNTPVDILAHSMGGLITRDAIGEAGHGNSAFPPSLLNVSRVVTVGTPHGGVYGTYADYAQDAFPGAQEVTDMTPGQPFMNLMSGIQDPQGAAGTTWALMAASNACFLPGNTTISCQAEVDTRNQPFPDGDGVVQASSALQMQANFKILYGVENQTNNGNIINTFVADNTTEYGHEDNSCVPHTSVCLVPPFYLNDGTPPAQTTKAWICPSACTATDTSMSDMQVVANSNTSAPHSLAEMLSLLPPPPPTCSSTNETDNVEPGGTYTDNRGNTWHVYFDIKIDTVTNDPCQMRVVVRIFNPAPNGAWSGTTGVFAEVNGGVVTASIGKYSGSGTYQAHFVWRGPWFKVGPGAASYHIEDTEYNGSNPYIRAFADFTI